MIQDPRKDLIPLDYLNPVEENRRRIAERRERLESFIDAMFGDVGLCRRWGIVVIWVLFWYGALFEKFSRSPLLPIVLLLIAYLLWFLWHCVCSAICWHFERKHRR